MNEKPILFSAPMVRAILDGRKTQTRRIVKSEIALVWLDNAKFNPEFVAHPENDMCPHGKIGERLWVREKFQPYLAEGYDESEFNIPNYKTGLGYEVSYPATDEIVEWIDSGGKVSSACKPSIHMPRWASRITLEITNVRVERLQDISETDSVSEGCYTNEQYSDLAGIENLWPCHACNGWQVHGDLGSNMCWTEVDCIECDTSKKRFKHLWQSINGPESWELNPWVWVIEFKRLT